MSRSKLDQTQIIQSAFDEESSALKVAMVPIEMTLEGSSRTVVQGDGAVDATGYEYVCLYGTGVVEISPDSDPLGATYYTLTLTALEPKLICCNLIKITGTGKLVIQSV